MTELGIQLVQTLAASLSASQFGAMVCFVPTVNIAEHYNAGALHELAEKIRQYEPATADTVDPVVFKTTRAFARRDDEECRKQWTELTKIIQGKAHVAERDRAGRCVMFERVGEILSGAGRDAWLKEGMLFLKIPEIDIKTADEKLACITNMSFRVVRGNDKYYLFEIKIDNGNAEIIIKHPKDAQLITELEIRSLIVRWLVKERKKRKVDYSFFADSITVSKNRIMRPFDTDDFTPQLANMLSRCLRDKSWLGSLQKFAFKEDGAPIRDEAEYIALADHAAKVSEALGCRLYALALRIARYNAMYHQNRIVTEAFWRKAVEAVENAVKGEEAPVSYALYKKILGGLGNSNKKVRNKWLMDGLREIGITGDEGILESLLKDLDRCTGIYVTFEKSRDDCFKVSADFSPHDVFVSIELPRDEVTLDEKKIKGLAARAVLLAGLSVPDVSKGHRQSRTFMFPNHIREELRRVTGDEISSPIPLSHLGPGKMTHIGPNALSEDRQRSIQNAYDTLVALFSSIRSAGLSDGLPRFVGRFSNKTMGPLKQLLSVPNIGAVLCKQLASFGVLSPDILFRVEEEREEDIIIKLNRSEGNTFVMVEVPASQFRKLSPEDIITIYFTAVGIDHIKRYKAELREIDRNRAGGFNPRNAKKRAEIEMVPYRFRTFADIRADMSPELKHVASLVELVYDYGRIARLKRMKDINIYGKSEESVQIKFHEALSGVHSFLGSNEWETAHIAWAPVSGIRYWMINATDPDAENIAAECIPVGEIGLINISGDAEKISTQDWLYVLSAMAANQRQAIKIKLPARDLVIGNRGDLQAIYGSIAANPDFKFGALYDRRVTGNSTLVSFSLPGGVPATAHPAFERASVPIQRQFINALRWFAMVPLRDEWRPRASDTPAQSKKRRLDMSFAMHPDRNPDMDVQNLFKDANEQWKAIEKMNGLI